MARSPVIGIVSDKHPKYSLTTIRSIRQRGMTNRIVVVACGDYEPLSSALYAGQTERLHTPRNVPRDQSLAAGRWLVIRAADAEDVVCFLDATTVVTGRTEINRIPSLLERCSILGGSIVSDGNMEPPAYNMYNDGNGHLRLYPGYRSKETITNEGLVDRLYYTDVLSTFHAAYVSTFRQLHNPSDRARLTPGLDLYLRAKSVGLKVAAAPGLAVQRQADPVDCASSRAAWTWPHSADMVKVVMDEAA